MLTTYLSYTTTAANLAKDLTRTAAEPAVKRETSYYLANIGKVTTADAFLKNDRLFRFAMKAYGLEDMTYAKGLIRKVLEGGTASTSVAGKMNDRRYIAFAQAFDFKGAGAAATSAASAGQEAVDKYVRLTLEDEVGEDNAGAKMALYFQRNASKTTSAYGILADKTLLSVVQTAFGLSSSMANLDIDVQAKMIKAKLSVSDLQDTKKVDALLKRFAANYDANNATSTAASPGLTILSGGTSFGLSTDQLLSLQKLR